MIEKLIRKLIYGNKKYSRFYDEKGNKITLNRFLLNAPRALFTCFLRIGFSYRPSIPWISYSAIKYLKGFLSKDKTVLEFGSGMSTVWYSRKAKHVFSVEDYELWFDKVNKIIRQLGIDNIDYEFHVGNKYFEFKKYSHEKFDLIMIDGNDRYKCALNAINLIKDNGVIYLDNSDQYVGVENGDTRLAENLLLDFTRKNGGDVIYFTDFSPTQFFVQQGMLCKFKKIVKT